MSDACLTSFIVVLFLFCYCIIERGRGVGVPEVEGNMAYNMAYYCEIVNTMNV